MQGEGAHGIFAMALIHQIHLSWSWLYELMPYPFSFPKPVGWRHKEKKREKKNVIKNTFCHVIISAAFSSGSFYLNSVLNICEDNSYSYFQTVSVRYFAGTYRSSCTKSPHRSLISIKVWEWSTSSCRDRQKESGTSVVKEDTVWAKQKYRWTERKQHRSTHLPINIQNTLISSKHIRFVGKRGICAQHRLLIDTVVALLALVGERQSRDVLISIVISTVMLSLHAWLGSSVVAWTLTNCYFACF